MEQIGTLAISIGEPYQHLGGRLMQKTVVFARYVLSLLEVLLLILIPVQVQTSGLCDEEVGSLRGAIDPVHHHNLFIVFSDGDGELAITEVGKECSLDGQEQHNIFLVIVGQVSNDICFSKLEYFQVIFVDDVQDVLVINDGDVLLVVVKIFSEARQSFLDLLDLLVFFCEGQLEQMRWLLH